MRFPLAFAALFVLAATLGCERPFVDEVPPGVRAVTPDTAVIQPPGETVVRVDAESFRSVERVEIDGIAATFLEESGVWEAVVNLNTGLNRIPIAAFDSDDVAGLDTLALLSGTFRGLMSPAQLPEALGYHTATRLPNADVLLAGGVSSLGGEALTSAWRSSGLEGFQRLPGLVQARAGHTATPLPDGRVLILGGATTDAPTDPEADFVETPELYDPETDRFTPLRLEFSERSTPDPIRRAFHQTMPVVIEGRTFLFVHGGRGDTRYNPPTLSIRSDMRVFEYVGDALVATGPRNQYLLDPLDRHAIAPLAPNAYLLVGSYFVDDRQATFTKQIDFTRIGTFGIDIRESAQIGIPREAHTASGIEGGYVVVAGGRAPNGLVMTPEIYAAESNRWYRAGVVKDDGFGLGAATTRYGHAATLSPGGRILLWGGFDAQGDALATLSFVDALF